MAEVTVYDATRMKAIEDATVVNGEIVDGHLILTRFDTTPIDAGNVVSVAVVTSGTRPGAPTTGLFIYETDTKRTYVWDSTAWRFVGDKYICTAATRPTGTFLFEGLGIYETDTDREYIYTGTAWLYVRGGTDPVAVSAVRDAALNTTGAVATQIIVWNTERYDAGNCYNTGTGVYTSPITGILRISSRVSVVAASGDRFVYVVHKNGNEIIRGTDITSAGAVRIASMVSADVLVNAGDTLDVRMSQPAGAARPYDTGGNGELGYMCIGRG